MARKGRDWSPRGPEGIPLPFESGDIIIPGDLTYPEKALEVLKILGGGFFEASPVGGGFVMKFGPVQMEKYKFRKVLQDEMVMPWRRGKFSMDFLGDTTIPGWTTGDVWNGWATPFFEKKEAEQVMKASADLYKEIKEKFKWSYNAKKDMFIFQSEHDEEPDRTKGSEIPTPEGMKTVYGIGAYSWTWQEEEQEEE